MHYYCNFYRATLCTAQTMPSRGACLSMCLSDTRRYSVEIAKHILKLFSPSGSHMHHYSLP